MLIQEKAVQVICESLKQDSLVQAVFLKGSMGRGEEDEYSDVDLYCLVEEKDKEAFLMNRKRHLQAFGEIIFHDDIFIVAPQIIAVYDNLLHVDLFTVTLETLIEKDHFRILYDPKGIMEGFAESKNLAISVDEYTYHLEDTIWFLFQYKKSAGRGNDLWSVKLLHDLMVSLSRVLLYRYAPHRAQLGLKTVDDSLPSNISDKLKEIFRHMTPEEHPHAAYLISRLIEEEKEWMLANENEGKIELLFQRMVALYRNEG